MVCKQLSGIEIGRNGIGRNRNGRIGNWAKRDWANRDLGESGIGRNGIWANRELGETGIGRIENWAKQELGETGWNLAICATLLLSWITFFLFGRFTSFNFLSSLFLFLSHYSYFYRWIV
jgi:hypothetical protein